MKTDLEPKNKNKNIYFYISNIIKYILLKIKTKK